MKQYGVYILQSIKNNRYYIGSTDNVERRLQEHNIGKVSSTRNLQPWIIKAFIECSSLTEAKSSEYRLKQYKRKDITEKAIKDLTFPWNYISPS
jgi:putative endonuclease